MTLKIGSDPELFVYDKKQKKIISAHDLVPGTKSDPYSLGLSTDYYGSVQADGTAVEYNTVPAATLDGFLRTHERTLREIIRKLPEHCRLVVKPSIQYDREYFDTLPPVATELGCDPDYNAYTGHMNVIPSSDKYPTLRTGAGHIHIGWLDKPVEDPHDEDHFNDCRILVQNMDKAYEWADIEDKKDLRTVLYGAKGSFRPKPYGLEYRVPSNRWVGDADLQVFMFKLAEYVFSFTCRYGLEENITNYLTTRTAILSHDGTSNLYTPRKIKDQTNALLPAIHRSVRGVY